MFELGVAFKRNFGTAPTNHCAESRGTPWPLGRLDQLGETGGAAFAARAGQSIRMPHGSQGRGFHSARVFRASPAMEEHLTRSSQRTNASRGPLQSRGVRETLQSLDPGGITGQEFGPWVGFLPLLPEITNIGAGKFFDQHALCWPAGERVCQALAGVAGSGFGASGEGWCCQVWCCRKTWEVFQVSLRSRT